MITYVRFNVDGSTQFIGLPDTAHAPRGYIRVCEQPGQPWLDEEGPQCADQPTDSNVLTAVTTTVITYEVRYWVNGALQNAPTQLTSEADGRVKTFDTYDECERHLISCLPYTPKGGYLTISKGYRDHQETACA